MNQESELVVGLIDQALAAALLHEDANTYQQDIEQSFKTAGLSLDQAYPFSVLVPILFDVLPKPSNGFHFANSIRFDRNQDCVCGSGKKLKKCCSELMSLPSVTSEEMFYAALKKLDAKTLLRLADKPGWHKQALYAFFDVAMENHVFEAVTKLAPVVVGQINKLKNSDDELVSTVLDALFEEGLTEQRLELMHSLTELKQAKSLRSLGYQRLAMIAAQEHNEVQAREFIQHAIQADGKQPELPMCELTVLGFIGSEQELKSRAKYWLAFTQKRWGDDHPIVDFIHHVLQQGKAIFDEQAQRYGAFDESLGDMDDEWGETEYENAARLADVFDVGDLPYIHVLEETESGTGLFLKSSLVKHKLAFLDAFDQQTDLVRQALGRGKLENEYIAKTWHWPDLKWIDLLEKHPRLLADFDVLDRLMSFVYQGPEPIEDVGAELNELSVFGFLSVVFRLRLLRATVTVLDHLPANTKLPEHLDANENFWNVAYDVFMDAVEAGAEDVVQDLRQRLRALCTNPPKWLAE